MHHEVKRGAFFIFPGVFQETRGAFSAEPGAFGVSWCILQVFIHIAGRLFQLQLYGGFENGDHPKNCRQKNDNRITVPLEQFVVVEVP